MRRVITSLLAASAIGLVSVLAFATSAADAQTMPPNPPPSGFASQPTFSGDGFAFAVYQGGSIDQLQNAARGVGASGIWMQDAGGRYYLLVVDAPPFVAAPVAGAFPSGFTSSMAVTLVRARNVVPAPVERAAIVVTTSFPAQYFVAATFGLPNGCHTFNGTEVRRQGDTITITATNNVTTAAACTQVYGFVDRNIALGSDFVRGVTYTVRIDDVTRTFVAG